MRAFIAVDYKGAPNAQPISVWIRRAGNALPVRVSIPEHRDYADFSSACPATFAASRAFTHPMKS